MSTRSSIYYGNGLHIFEEAVSGELVFDFEQYWYGQEGPEATKTNDFYGGVVLTKDQAREVVRHLATYLDKDKA